MFDLTPLFKDWIPLINVEKTLRVMGTLETEYSRYSICPRQDCIFKAFQVTPYKDLKVVIIGQDPYPQQGIATGLAFANDANTPDNKISPSLELIMDELLWGDFPPYKFDITLESWAKQGVLLLNSALTVRYNIPNSHNLLWRPFMSSLLEQLSQRNTGIIYLLFGEQAKSFKSFINPNTNYILEYPHPAYQARLKQRLNCDGFDKANQILKQNNNLTINWYEKL